MMHVEDIFANHAKCDELHHQLQQLEDHMEDYPIGLYMQMRLRISTKIKSCEDTIKTLPHATDQLHRVMPEHQTTYLRYTNT